MVRGLVDAQGWQGVMISGAGRESLELELQWHAPLTSEAVEVWLLDHQPGLPDDARHRRPPGTIGGERFPFSDGIFVSRRYQF